MKSEVLIWLAAVVVGGVATKLYAGPVSHWVSTSFSGVFYVMFWCLLFFFIFPRGNIGLIAVLVFVATSLVEVSQLYRPPLLSSFRSSFVGRSLLGTTFVWSDFCYYLAGCLLGWFLMKHIQERT